MIVEMEGVEGSIVKELKGKTGVSPFSGRNLHRRGGKYRESGRKRGKKEKGI